MTPFKQNYQDMYDSLEQILSGLIKAEGVMEKVQASGEYDIQENLDYIKYARKRAEDTLKDLIADPEGTMKKLLQEIVESKAYGG